MKTTLETRLERAGQTLDRASEEYQAGAGRTAGEDDLDAVESARRVPMLVSVGTAALTIVLVGAVFVAVRDGGGPVTSASGDGAPFAGAGSGDVGPAADAVAATRAAQAMAVATVETVESSDGVSRVVVDSWNYGAPDRWEQLSPTGSAAPLGVVPPDGVTVRLYVGSESWTVDDGRWVAEPAGQADPPAPLALLDSLLELDCHVDVGGELVLWASADTGCDTGGSDGVPDLPTGTAVWAIDVDEHGRISQVDAGTVLDLGPHANVEGSTKAINRVGAFAGTTTAFLYEGVAEVPARPEE